MSRSATRSRGRRQVSTQIDTRVWDRIMANVDTLTDERVKVGVLTDAEHEEGGGSLMVIAATHEFGAPEFGIRERSYLRSTFAEHAVNEMRQKIAGLATAVINGRVQPRQALGLLGAWAVGAVKRSITSKLIVQDLSPRTIALKGSSTALVDSGQLKNSIAWEIK